MSQTTNQNPSADEDPRTLLRQHFENARILVAEDDRLSKLAMRALIRNCGLQVDIASDGAEAIAMASQTKYDLILMDLHMPEVDGFEATRRIRALPLNGVIPILALTGNAFDHDREACLSAGMAEHISKPVLPQALYSAMLKWL